MEASASDEDDFLKPTAKEILVTRIKASDVLEKVNLFVLVLDKN